MKLTKKQILDYHKNGKISLNISKPCDTQKDLAIAYTPGVAVPCLEIKKNKKNISKYTNKQNTILVVSNGTAVLGLGDIGPAASKPVMEGKCVLFKKFADLDAWDIEVDETNPKKFVEIVAKIATGFGGVNLEDIKAPECFYIERELQKKLSVPVFHDDQHGTAIISGAALLNALKITKKDIKKIKVVFSGDGAAGTACKNYYIKLGVNRKNIKTVNKQTIKNLDKYIKNADVFVGLSVKNILTVKMLKSMAESPIVFAMANPDPEIKYETAIKARPDVIMATGRSDYPNQINNVLGFPFIFRGALDAGAQKITLKMMLAATHALADIAKKPVPKSVLKAYNIKTLKFGPNYIVPKPFDPRLKKVVSEAVRKSV